SHWAAAAGTGLVTLWDVGSGKKTRSFKEVLNGLPKTLVFGPQGRHLAAVSENELTVWEVATARPILQHPSSAQALIFDAAGLVIFGPGGIQGFDLTTGKVRADLPDPRRYIPPTSAAAFSPEA